MIYIFLFFFNSSVLASEMQDKVIEASYQQSGLKGNVELLMRYGKSRVEYYGWSKELGAITYITHSIRAKLLMIPIEEQLTLQIQLDRCSVTYRW